ncbi:MAG: hypothetical protein G01um101448_398 [Parcubacteria group bacterium Gr01-1014_48]|nr:MAG: hypothetical protein Greene041614_753 [Parcubacteria group bacterium Greene0416_14]TSC74018.1 MAG: hypothetical protein G01um101448_398 [Parcubacteria group bacterium Gr01-1014_48]TSD00796.1 MAG: hypothetical protein Greene101415_696 [Parcubacteria group bacterium Greene1014_15]TSD07206.1 MAG: hypothetical protein Greene07144_987 [Parcubacteria group bacterium Greene0714_4]
MKATKQQLLDRIKSLLELPGVCAESKRETILGNCEKLSFEQLCEVAATLRIRARKLASIINSPEKIQEIKDAKDNLDKFFTKYGI